MTVALKTCLGCEILLVVPSSNGFCETCHRNGTTPKDRSPASGEMRPTLSFDPDATREFDSNSRSSDTRRPSGKLPPSPSGYSIEEHIGTGGTATVFRALEHGTNRIVAIKFVQRAHIPSVSERLEREVRALGQLRHPNILPIYSCHLDELSPFFVMEYSSGGSLSELLRQRRDRLPLETIVRFGISLANGIAAAHQEGIVHRDLKPGNLLIGDDRQLKVADFGMARNLDNDPTITQDNAILGTPCYMSPEQASGKLATKLSDVYGIGAVLYELMTGQPPYREANNQATIHAVLNKEFNRPSKMRPDLPADLEAIVEKCLARDPAKRYISAEKVAEDLVRFQQGLETDARPLTAVKRYGRMMWRHRRRILATVAGIIVAGAIISAAVIPAKTSQTVDKGKTPNWASIKQDWQKKWDANQPITIVPKGQAPFAFEWWLSPATIGPSPTGDSDCYFQSVGRSLLTLFEPPGEKYRVTIELRQISAGSTASQGIGLFFSGVSLKHNDEDGLGMVLFQFKEWDHENPMKRIESKYWFGSTLMNRSVGKGFGGQTHEMRWRQNPEIPHALDPIFFQTVSSLPSPWRTIELTVSDEIIIRTAHDGEEMKTVIQKSRDDVDEQIHRDRMAKIKAFEILQKGAGKDLDPKLFPSPEILLDHFEANGKIGIVTNHAGIAIRSMTVERIP